MYGKTLIALLLASTPVWAAPYDVDTTASRIGFGGTHAGNAFEGTFERWTAEIDFDAAVPEHSKLKAVIGLASAKTGNAMYDGTLPTADWFDVANTPQGVFESTSVQRKEREIYTVTGTLTIRGKSVPVSFDVTLPQAQLDTGAVDTTFTLTLNRLDFGIGAKSDATAEWVSNPIDLKIRLVAHKR